jgi:hypothetical protein
VHRQNQQLSLPKIPFSGFHQCNIVTLRSKLATVAIRQGHLENTNPVAVTLTDFKNAKGKFIFKNTFQDQTIKDLEFSFSVAQTFNISAGFMNSNVFDTTTCPGKCNTTMVTVSATGTATGLSPQQTVGVVFANETYKPGANDVLFTVTPSLRSPEPSSLILFGIGLAGLALWQCKRSSLNRIGRVGSLLRRRFPQCAH